MASSITHTIHNQGDTSDVTCTLREQKKSSVLNIPDGAHALQCNRKCYDSSYASKREIYLHRNRPWVEKTTAKSAHAFGVSNGTRSNTVYANTKRSKLNCPVLCQGINGSFGGTGVLLIGQAGVIQGGADVDDRALGSLDVLGSSFGQVESTEQVNLNDGAEGIVRQVLERSQKVSSSTVDKEIDASKLFNGLLHRILNVSRLAYVCRNGSMQKIV